MNWELDNIDRAALQSETEILHLLYYRNRNQFKSTVWWKHFSMLHRHCKHTVDWLIRGEIVAEKTAKLVKFLVSKLIPSAYRSFNAVIAQGQFINLGIALIAALGRIHALLVAAKPARTTKAPIKSEQAVPSEKAIDEPAKADVGQVIDRSSIKTEVQPKVAESTKKSKKRSSEEAEKPKPKKKKKTSKKASAIDDIFGF